MKIKKRAKKIINLKQFNNKNKPEKLKKIEVCCPYQEQYILRMLIKKQNEDFKIPKELEWLKQLLEESIKYQKEKIKINHSFCYITVRHGFVKSKDDDVFHSDGFTTKTNIIPEQNYVWSNVESTEYVIQKIKFPKDFNPLKHNIHFYFQKIIKEKNIKKMKEKTLYCIDPYVIHRRPKLENNIQRTFVRITFAPIEIIDINNTLNPLIETNYKRDGLKDFRDHLIRYSLK